MDAYRQHELPETVKRYKQYTDAFQEWLMKTAVQRGVESAAQIAEQAKIKKKGKKAYKMSAAQQQTLVDGIASSKEPLSDTSGLRDLQDAIRSRKEVTQYHKHSSTWDAGHAFFNVVLESAHTKLTTFISLIPVMLKSQDLEDEASTFIAYRFQRDIESDDDDDDVEPTRFDQTSRPEQHQEDIPLPSKSKEKGQPMSKKDAELRRDFLVLCFLYELNRVREIVREAWMAYREDEATSITAALVTDLAQSYIQQTVAALVEDLASYDSVLQLPLSTIVRQLFAKLSGGGTIPKTTTPPSGLSDTALRHLFCIKALDHLEAYAKPKALKKGAARDAPDPKLPFLPFLRHFDAIRKKQVALPIWDKFTESMVRSNGTPDMYLPFGFQIVLDANETMGAEYRKINQDVVQQGFDIARLIRTHTDYEDRMWESGTKPDYMSKGNMKFSNVYLSSLDCLLNWIQEVLKTKESERCGTASTYVATDAFVAMHPTMAGLSIWNFNKTYAGFSITKVNWFVTAICHLYNAAKQVGGLDVIWPDLDYIMELHETERIFVGEPPTDPNDFLERYYLSACVSSRSFAKDFRSTGNNFPSAPPEVRKKRGLMAHFPLEEAIGKYYGPDRKNDRWLKRHAIFNHLHNVIAELDDEFICEHIQLKTDELSELQDNFESMISKMAPGKSKNRRKKNTRVRPPKVTQIDTSYPELLRTMNICLQANEMHSNFDYLALYRRAHALVLRVRKEVLYDEASQLARRSDIRKEHIPSNSELLIDLFRALKIKPKDKKIEPTGDELSTDVVPLEQLKRIARIMKEVINEEGSEELGRAKMRRDRDWDGLKAAYAADDVKGDNHIPQTERGLQPPAEPEEDTGMTEQAKTEVDDVKESADHVEQPPCLPPGHWPTDLEEEQDHCDTKAAAPLEENAEPNIADEDTEESEESTAEDSSVSDKCPGCDNCTASDSDPEIHSTGDTSKIDTKRDDQDILDAHREPSNARMETGGPKKKLHQAHVVDEADTEIQDSERVSTRDSGSKCLPASKVDDDTEPAEEAVSGVSAERVLCSTQDVAERTVTGALIDEQKPSDIMIDITEDDSGTPQDSEDMCCRLGLPVPHDDGDDSHVREEWVPVSAATFEELLKAFKMNKAKHNSKPQGVFHRLVYSRNALRKRLVTIKRTPAAPHLTFARRHKGYYRRSIVVTRKHTVSLRCYAACSLARALLGKESKRQCRLQEATKAVLAQESYASLDLQAAWHTVSVTMPEKSDVGDHVWVDDAASVVPTGDMVRAIGK
jgi:hypothetical protein